MTPPDEVLRKMAEAAGYAEFITCDAATCNGMCEAPEVHFAPAIQRALTAAAECGWKLQQADARREGIIEGLKMAMKYADIAEDTGEAVSMIRAATLAAAPKVTR